jgi:hypothetical protein
MKHIMVDIETLGVSARAAIIQIGACEFDPQQGTIGSIFSADVEWRQEGRKVDAETLHWWFEQQQAGNPPPRGKEPLEDALGDFVGWLDHLGLMTGRDHAGRTVAEVCMWSKGPSFDLAILADAFRWAGWDHVPWRFGHERDARTVVALAREFGWVTTEGPARHNALLDARAQACDVMGAIRFLTPDAFAPLDGRELDLEAGWEIYRERTGANRWYDLPESARVAFEDAVRRTVERRVG